MIAVVLITLKMAKRILLAGITGNLALQIHTRAILGRPNCENDFTVTDDVARFTARGDPLRGNREWTCLNEDE
jgi:hypothetical protein